MWTLRDRHFSDRWSRETKTLGTRLGLWAHPFWRASPSNSRCRSSSYTHNHGKISLGHLCNVTNYLCFTTEVWKSAAILLKTCCCSPPRPIQRWKSGEIAGTSFQHCMGGGGWGMRLDRWSCIRVWRVRKSAKSANLSQDICSWLQFSLCNMHAYVKILFVWISTELFHIMYYDYVYSCAFLNFKPDTRFHKQTCCLKKSCLNKGLLLLLLLWLWPSVCYLSECHSLHLVWWICAVFPTTVKRVI